MVSLKGHTTVNNKWETLTDKELVKHDLLLYIYTSKGDCDWNPNLGTSIMRKIFQLKTEELKLDIMNELEFAVSQFPQLTLHEITANDIDKGWIFNIYISYSDEDTEVLSLNISEESAKLYKSTGNFPLGETA